MKCAVHSDVETNLSCSKCGKPICSRCLVQTPVGARCRDCARPRRVPTYQLSPGYYLKAIAGGLGTAAVSGVVWWLLEGAIPYFSLDLLLAAAAGYLISEAIGLCVNRKRGVSLAIIGGVCLVISYLVKLALVGVILLSPYNIGYHLLALVIGVYVAVQRLR